VADDATVFKIVIEDDTKNQQQPARSDPPAALPPPPVPLPHPAGHVPGLAERGGLSPAGYRPQELPVVPARSAPPTPRAGDGGEPPPPLSLLGSRGYESAMSARNREAKPKDHAAGDHPPDWYAQYHQLQNLQDTGRKLSEAQSRALAELTKLLEEESRPKPDRGPATAPPQHGLDPLSSYGPAIAEQLRKQAEQARKNNDREDKVRRANVDELTGLLGQVREQYRREVRDGRPVTEAHRRYAEAMQGLADEAQKALDEQKKQREAVQARSDEMLRKRYSEVLSDQGGRKARENFEADNRQAVNDRVDQGYVKDFSRVQRERAKARQDQDAVNERIDRGHVEDYSRVSREREAARPWERAEDTLGGVSRVAGAAGMGNVAGMAAGGAKLAAGVATGNPMMAIEGGVQAAGKAFDFLASGVKLARDDIRLMGDMASRVAANDGLGAVLKAGDHLASGIESTVPIIGKFAGELVRSQLEIVNAYRTAVNSFVERGKELQQYSPALSVAGTRANLRGTLGDIREARELGPQLARMIDLQSRAESEMRQLILPIKDLLIRMLNTPLSALVAVLVKVVPLVEKVIKGAAETRDATYDAINAVIPGFKTIILLIRQIRDGSGKKEGEDGVALTRAFMAALEAAANAAPGADQVPPPPLAAPLRPPIIGGGR
jgi:hypothetical protein